MNIKRRDIFFIVLSILIILLFLSLFYFSRPLVLYVSSDILSSFDISKPSLFTFDYRTKYISEDELIDIKNGDLLILDPFSSSPESVDIKSYRWGSSSENENDFIVDEEMLWSYALSKSVGTIAFLYPENLSIAEILSEKYPDVKSISYNGRISNANYDDIISKLNGIENVLLLDPESSLLVLAEEKTFFVDFRDYPALKDKDNVKAIVPDWNSAIKEALESESGDISFDFTFS